MRRLAVMIALSAAAPLEVAAASSASGVSAIAAEVARRYEALLSGGASPPAPEATAPEPEILSDRIARDDLDDVLADPAVLAALARMPEGRAARILEMLERRQAGQDPLAQVPPLSLDAAPEPPPVSLALAGWRLTRAPDGSPELMLGDDPLSRLPVRVGMVLGATGRVLALRDGPDAFYLVTGSGDRIEGAPLAARTEVPEPGIDGPELPEGSLPPLPPPAPEAAPSPVPRPDAES